MGLPVEVNNLMMGSLRGYTVGRSLRFRSSASAYLNRTPASASNRKTWTWSGWVKRGTLGVNQHIFGGWDGSNNATGIYFATNDTIEVFSIQVSPTTYSLQLDTTQVFRDPSAWYHFVLAIDTTQATASNRAKLYVNGVQITALSTASYPSQNSDLFVNTNAGQFLCRMSWSAASYLDGYLAEVNFIDGQALTPSSFGAYDTNGVWQPKKYTGTYGTNGFYLPFSNTTSTTTLVQDSSGNGNNWTPNNISLTAGATYDSMLDVPTNNSALAGNFCTINPLVRIGGTATTSNGNLNFSRGATQYSGVEGTFAIPNSGKYYFEVTGSTATYLTIGFANEFFSYSGTNRLVYTNTGQKINKAGTNSAYGASFTGTDMIGVAIDADSQQIIFYKNNVSQGIAFSGSDYTGFGQFFPYAQIDDATDTSAIMNFGQRPFTYTPPSGFKALNTYNLPAPSIANGAQYMAATLYTGNGSTNNIVNSQNNGGNNALGKSFYADFAWAKARSVVQSHFLANSITGTNKYLQSDTTGAETSLANSFTSFNSDGFTLGSSGAANGNTYTYVAWQWLAGAGSSSSNTSGSITSTVSANTTAGFSIVTYTGNGTAGATVGHGLGVAPNLVIWKKRSSTGNWFVWSKAADVAAGSTRWGYLNATNAFSTSASTNEYPTYKVDPTSTVLTLNGTGSSNGTNDSSATYVAYCFSAVSGYSAMGSYAGTGSSDGAFVYTGFRPRFIMWKNASFGSQWILFDTSRSTYNISNGYLEPNTSDTENTASAPSGVLDILSNGFKLRTAGIDYNDSSYTYVYAAFAENPFNISRAR